MKRAMVSLLTAPADKARKMFSRFTTAHAVTCASKSTESRVSASGMLLGR
jgi:hypothetical protein